MTPAALIDFYRIANMKRCVAIEPRIVCLLSKVLTQLAKKKEEKASCVSNVLIT